MEEYEVKFLDIDPVDVERKILDLGGKKIYDRVYVDKVFDYADLRLHEDKSWLRLRDKGDVVTLTYKRRFGNGENGNDLGMEEVEIEVSDFEITALLMEKVGFVRKFHEEKRCVHFVLDGVEVNIDTWPLMPPYLEIEAESWEKVREVSERLNFKWEDRVVASGMQVYEKYGINENDYEILTFSVQKKKMR